MGIIASARYFVRKESAFFFNLQVFEFLIRLHSTEAPPEEEIYPYVRTLLHFDTREFLNVLALVRNAVILRYF